MTKPSYKETKDSRCGPGFPDMIPESEKPRKGFYRLGNGDSCRLFPLFVTRLYYNLREVSTTRHSARL